jgi:hypothetical protein
MELIETSDPATCRKDSDGHTNDAKPNGTLGLFLIRQATERQDK